MNEDPARTVLVTGATGFIGSHVVDVLCRAGYTARLFAPASSFGDTEFPEQTERIAGDIRDGASVARALRGVSTVVHLAGRLAGSPYHELVDVNAHGTRVLVDACARSTTVERVLLLSSVVVYPQRFDPWAWPLSERSRIGPSGRRPDRAYAASKIVAENEMRRAAASSGLSYTIVRAAMSYGVGSDYCETLACSLVLDPPAPGSILARTVLQPVHVDDLARAIVDASTHVEAEDETLNIAGAEPISYLALSNLARELLRRSNGAARSRDQVRPWLAPAPFDMRKAQKLLRFRPEVSLARGLAEVVASLRRLALDRARTARPVTRTGSRVERRTPRVP